MHGLRRVLCWLLALAATAAPAAALTQVGNLDTPGDARDVATAGTLAYVADDIAGLRVIDFANPAGPVAIGFLPPPSLGRTQGVAIDDSRLVLAEGAAGLRVVDVAAPSTPVVVGSLSLPGFAYQVNVQGTLAYVASGTAGLRIVDLANPAHPVALGSAAVGDARDVDVSGGTAFVALAVGSAVVDVTNPAAPVVLTQLDGGGSRVALEGGFAYTRSGVYDVRAPASPVFLYGDFAFQGDIALLGGFGLVAAGAPLASALRLFDLAQTRETGAVLLGTLNLPPSNCTATDVEIGLGRAYIGTFTCGVHVVDVTDPSQPTWLGSVPVDARKLSLQPIAGGERLAGIGFKGSALDPTLWMIDVADATAPVLLGEAPIAGLGDVHLEGDYAYVATGSGAQAFHVFDVSDPALPIEIANDLLSIGVVTELRRAAAGLYVSPNNLDPSLLDLADPAHPTVLGTANTSKTGVRGIAADEHLAFVANGLEINTFSFFDPAQPLALGSLTIPGSSLETSLRDIDVYAGRAYLMTDDETWVVDVRDPSAPRLVSMFSPVGSGSNRQALRIYANRAYRVGGSNDNLEIFDVRQRGRLGFQLLDEVPLSGTAKAIAVDEARTLAVVAVGAAGLAIVDFAAEREARPCLDGFDNDDDGAIDAFEDGGCADGSDPDELPACANGLDDDGDGAIDHPADAGCRNALAGAREDPQCLDGIDDDGDGAIDYPIDARCSSAYDDEELRDPPRRCGLGGPELLALAAALAAARRRTARP